jgi:hypothetical protein
VETFSSHIQGVPIFIFHRPPVIILINVWMGIGPQRELPPIRYVVIDFVHLKPSPKQVNIRFSPNKPRMAFNFFYPAKPAEKQKNITHTDAIVRRVCLRPMAGAVSGQPPITPGQGFRPKVRIEMPKAISSIVF